MFITNKFFSSSVTALLIVLFCLSGCLFISKQDDPPSPRVLLNKMLRDLRSRIPEKSLRISIGNLTYQDSSVPSSFARYLSQEVSAAIHRTGTFEEFPRNRLDALLDEQNLSQKDLFDDASASKLGKLKGVQAILVGSYWKDKEIEKSFQSLGRTDERSLKKIADRGLVVEVDGSGKKGETAEDVCIYTIVE